MLSSGDIVTVDLGAPRDREAGFRRPAVVVTAQPTPAAGPSVVQVVQVVPLTPRVRGFMSEVEIEPDAQNRLAGTSAAQCQHVRSVAVSRLTEARGNVGAEALTRIRETLADLLDL